MNQLRIVDLYPKFPYLLANLVKNTYNPKLNFFSPAIASNCDASIRNTQML